jgi:ABC-type glucose/galactose transport system permease subunit
MQFGATAGCLYGVRRYSVMFYMAFIVQVNPFLMTLRRKNLANKAVVLVLYGLGLAGAVALVITDYKHHSPQPGLNAFFCQGLIANLAALLRLGPRLPALRIVQDNKYMLWISLGLLLRCIRPIFDAELSAEMRAVCDLLRFAMVGYGVYKGFLHDALVAKRRKPIEKSV